MARHPTDHEGKRYGQLVALHQVDRSACKKVRWLCQCDCGNKSLVLGTNLTSGNSQSCGRGHNHKTTK